MKRLLFTMLTVVWLTGCDSNSPNVKFVNGINVQYYYNPDDYPAGFDSDPQMLDRWQISSGTGEHIYSAAFGYVIEVETDGMPVGGIRVDAYVTDHIDPVYEDHRSCIWCKEAPDGRPYGYIRAYPDKTATWDWESQHASVKTSPSGRVNFLIGLGDSAVELGSQPDPGREWPVIGGGDDAITTLLLVKFVVHKHSGDVEKEVHMVFERAKYQDFWEPCGGVIGNSYSFLTSFNSSGMSLQGEELGEELTGSCLEEVPGNRVTSSNSCSSALDGDQMMPALIDDDWTYVGGLWMQYVFDGYYNWYWVYNPSIFKGLVSPGSPNDAVEMLSLCEPYVFYCEVDIAPSIFWPFYEDVYQFDPHFVYTVILVSKSESGEVVSQLPVKLYPYKNLYDPDHGPFYSCGVRMWSEFVVPIDSLDGEGRYWDWYVPSNSGVFIYVPENGYLELKVDDFYGDFDFDGYVDFEDFALFSNKWYQGTPDIGYDLMYDADRDGQTTEIDLITFTKNWLGERL